MSDALDELDAFLMVERDQNTWGDVDIDDACEIVPRLTEGDWDRLAELWPSRPFYWQQRLGDVVDCGPQPRAFAMHVAMLEYGDTELATWAAGHLDAGANPRPVPARLRRRLEELRDAVIPGARPIVDSLLARMSE